jgi:hypothetical protein
MSALTSLLLSPWMLGFLGLMPVLIALYLLKLRRTEVTIASTLLWHKSLQDLTANAPFQRLRANLLLFLQLLILLLLILALARPFVQAQGLAGRNRCIVIDRSASMQTREANGQLRLDLAKARALELVASMRDGDRMMVVAFGGSAEVRTELTDDRRRLRQAIEGITAADTATRIRDVANIVRSLAPENPEAAPVVAGLELVLFSDGKLSDTDALNQVSMERFTYARIGESRDNAGIVAFSVRQESAGLGQRQAFVQLYNARESEHRGTLSLYYTPEDTGDGEALLVVDEVVVAPGAAEQVIFALPQLESGLLRATLDEEDALAADNSAWVILEPERGLRVLLVGGEGTLGGHFLRKVLLVDPRVDLTAAAPGSYADSAGFDLTIFHGWAPETLPGGALLFIDAPPPIAGVEDRGVIERPPVLATAVNHPLTRFLNPGNLRVAKARDIALPEGATPLITTEGGALAADLSQGAPGTGSMSYGQRIAYVAFALEDSDWPLHLSFPLFFQNLLNWVEPHEAAARAAIATGAPIEVPPPAPGETNPGMTARVVTPSGEEAVLERDPLRPVYFAGTETAGLYAVHDGGATRFTAANLLDKNESDIAPAAAITLGEGSVAALDGTLRYNREYWHWLAALGLAVLVVEWWLYSRRAWL